MAFKFPSSNWQEPNGFERAEGRCVVCGSTHDLGKKIELAVAPEEPDLIVCRSHSHCQMHAVMIIAECIRTGTRISKAAFDAGRWNSYDRDAMLPHFSDELLIEHTAYTLKNCSRIRTPASTYEDVIQLYAAELSKRLQERIGVPPSNVSEEGVTELVFQPLARGESCVADVVLDDSSIERYEVRRMDL